MPCDVMSEDPKVHGDINTIVTEVIGSCEAFDSSAIGQTMRRKVHAPNIVDLACDLK